MYDPRDKNVISETSGSGITAPDRAAQPSGSGFAVYFLGGVAGIMLLMALTYGTVFLMHKTGWFRSREEDESADNEAAEMPFWKRMSPEERRKALDEALEAKPHKHFTVGKRNKEKDMTCFGGKDGTTQKENVDESSLGEDGDSFDVDVESESASSTSISLGDNSNGDAVNSSDRCAGLTSSLHTRCTSRQRNNAGDPEMGTTTHIHPQLNESHVACSICLDEYQAEDEVVIGRSCTHMFHKSCAMEWLEKQEACPCCREQMISDEQMCEAASAVLSAERIQELENVQNSGDDAGDEIETEQRIAIPAW